MPPVVPTRPGTPVVCESFAGLARMTWRHLPSLPGITGASPGFCPPGINGLGYLGGGEDWFRDGDLEYPGVVEVPPCYHFMENK